MVNNIATLRGRVKERARAFVETDAGFRHTKNNRRVIEANRQKFNLLYPNTFHCKVSTISWRIHAAYMLIFSTLTVTVPASRRL